MRAVVFVALGLSTLAFAKVDGGGEKPREVLNCSDPEAKAETTVQFNTYESRTIAIIRKSGKLAAELPCFDTGNGGGSADKPEPLKVCYDPSVVDAGLRATLTKPDFTGRQWTAVTEMTIAGEKEVANLPCIVQ